MKPLRQLILASFNHVRFKSPNRVSFKSPNRVRITLLCEVHKLFCSVIEGMSRLC